MASVEGVETRRALQALRFELLYQCDRDVSGDSRDKSPMSGWMRYLPPLSVSRSGYYPLQSVPGINRKATRRTRRRQGWWHPQRKRTKPVLKHSFTTNFILPLTRAWIMTEARARELEGLGH